MLAMARKAALAEWRARGAERDRRAAVAAVAARQARPAARETAPGNSLTAAGGNGRGNDLALSGGNTLALTAGGPAPAQGRDDAPGAGGETGTGDDLEGRESGLASVSPMRRPAVTDEEIRMLAEALADEFALEGRPLTVRAYTDRYGGKTSRVSPVIAEVKAAREDQAAETAAGAR
jgi:hypothetical protein